ncbi:MAG: ribonuclease P protein component [Anaerolineae bacterium]|nr:ribonuclease P protein component [Anaerolineae bacterium]
MERRIRLRRPADFERVRQEGCSLSHPLLVLVVRPSGFDCTRIGVVASRKIGNAVARNRARRLLRESARHLYPRIASGWDLVLIARPMILRAKEPQVREALALLARQAALLE